MLNEHRQIPQSRTRGTPQFNGGSGRGPVPATERKTDGIQHLWNRHHEMKRLALLGWGHKEIATKLGVCPTTVTNCLNSAIMRRELDLARGAINSETVDIAKKLREMNVKAVAVLEEILDNEEAPVVLRAKVAMDNLSRTGYAPQVNVRGTIEHHHLTAEDVEQIKQAALSAGARFGLLEDQTVDCEFKQIN
jgi:hypothetical protein